MSHARFARTSTAERSDDPQPVVRSAAATAAAESGRHVLPGQALPARTREVFGERLGHDFSRVRIHADGQAAAAARAVHADAFTFGSDIVFGAGQYRPETPEGNDLLEHELTHVAEQSAARAPSLQRRVWIGAQRLTVNETYKEQVRKTWGEKAVRRLMELHGDETDHRLAGWSALVAEYQSAAAAPDVPAPGGTPVAEDEEDQAACGTLPGFGQRGGSCAAASLITPVLVWDNESYGPEAPNRRLRSLLQRMKTFMRGHAQTLKPVFEARQAGLYEQNIELLDDISSEAESEAFKPSSDQYQALGLMLMIISQQDRTKAGMNDAEMQTARSTLAFTTETKPVRFFGDFFEGDLKNMKPGQMAQITWFVKDSGPRQTDPLAPKRPLDTHAFTIGRLSNGTWILNDQGYAKPLCLTGPDLASLKDKMVEASEQDRWAGVTDDHYHEPPSGIVTGYTILGDEKTMLP